MAKPILSADSARFPDLILPAGTGPLPRGPGSGPRSDGMHRRPAAPGARLTISILD
jgi:hypothetical protein